eukprot:PRCOL_00000259-RA
MVVVGGITRLTKSGLSMTKWKFVGTLPPLTQEEWEEEFTLYKASPEFRKMHSWMTVEDFKPIFWWEYAHRMLGRGLGVAFAIPCAYFASRGMINAPLGRRLAALFVAGGSQGFVGWWMVKSGLEEPESEHECPRVSPYRLATHLMCAFAIYTGLLWTAMSVHVPTPAPATADVAAALRRVRRLAHPLAGLVAVTAASGAFVAGLEAGRAYNTFPTMNGQWVPDEVWDMTPLHKNFFENTALVQLDHRVLALSTFAASWATWFATRGLPLTSGAAAALHLLPVAASAQAALGVATLLHAVPVSLGSAHQAGALTLFTIVVALMHATRAPAVAARGAARAASAAAKVAQPAS